jgi:hypothetical protein
MQNQEEKAAKREPTVSWRKGPICAQEFKEFLPLIKHLEKHRRHESQLVKVELGAEDYLQKEIARAFSPLVPGADTGKNRSRPIGGASKRKLVDDAKGLLVAVADWLQEALMTFPEINTLLTSDLKVAEQLVGFARRLPHTFREQRDYLLRHKDRLEETGMDPKWPRKAGGQIRFVAESMAGSEWNLTPSTSREFIRERKPRKSAIPAQDQRWWERSSRESEEDDN